MMRRRGYAVVFVLAACSKTDKPAPSASSAEAIAAPSASARAHKKREDRHDPAQAPATPLAVAVRVGGATSTWDKATLDRVPKVTSGNVGNDGEDRDTWSLRDLARVLVGPKARVVAVTGEDGRRAIERLAWDDAKRTPILHGTRRGTLKFRWADANGKWGDAEVKDVSALEIEP